MFGLDLAARGHLEGDLRYEERRARPRGLLDGVGDVGVGEAGARVHHLVRVRVRVRVQVKVRV